MIRASAIKKNAKRKTYKKNGTWYIVKFIRVFDEAEESIEFIEKDNSNIIQVTFRHTEPRAEAEINIFQNL